MTSYSIARSSAKDDTLRRGKLPSDSKLCSGWKDSWLSIAAYLEARHLLLEGGIFLLQVFNRLAVVRGSLLESGVSRCQRALQLGNLQRARPISRLQKVKDDSLRKKPRKSGNLRSADGEATWQFGLGAASPKQ